MARAKSKQSVAPSNSPADSSNGITQDPLVLQQIHKRLRNLQKRLRGIDEIEAKREAGKPLNADQVCVESSGRAVGCLRWTSLFSLCTHDR